MASLTTPLASTARKAENVLAAVFGFGRFRYDTLRRELIDENGPVRVGSRALQLLEVLLESPGRVYGREELIARVWPRTIVEETSLRVHMSALSRVLGDGQDGGRYVVNLPGQGYALVAEVRVLPQAGVLSGQAVAHPPQGSRPRPRILRPIGRSEVIARVGELLATQRMVSIVGPGGMGKTTVALAAAEDLGSRHGQHWCFVNLASLADATLVATEVAQSCGLEVARGEPEAALEAGLRDRQMLIVLDNCEHLVDAVAALADRLMRTCSKLRILATSREPLELEGEWLLKLPPLGLPQSQEPLSLEAVQAYPAVQLFVERAVAACHTFRLSEDNVDTVRQLCATLDGIPLAIELAAARLDTFGERSLLLQLENAFEVLTRGRRTAMDRHQTLHAVLDWSYALLDEAEGLVLQRLSVFRGSFDLDSAVAVASDLELPGRLVMDAVLSLCSKSLVTPELSHCSVVTYRLLYITRLFAQRALAARPDASAVHRRHAEFVLRLLIEANKRQSALPSYRRDPTREPVVADLRAALTWALLDENDLVLGMEIIAEPRCMFMAADLIGECQRHLTATVDKIEQAGVTGTRLEFRLQKQLTFISAQTLGDRRTQLGAFARTRDLADRSGSTEDRLEALYAMVTAAYGHGDYLQSLACCDEVRELAQGEFEVVSVALGDRLAALNLHALGQHDAAERLAYKVMSVDAGALPWSFLSHVAFPVSMRIQLARIQWLRGDFERSWTTVQEMLVREEGAHVQSRCQPLGMAAILIALWKGDLQAAGGWTRQLSDEATRGDLPYWLAFAKVYGAVLERRPVQPGSAEAQLLAESTPLMDIHATLQAARPHASTLARVRQGAVGWCAPEVLRLAALAGFDGQGEGGRARCIAALHEAFELSVEQGAKFWSLRIAISVLRVARNGSAEQAGAREQLRALLRGIDDGSAIPDLLQARLLAEPEKDRCDAPGS